MSLVKKPGTCALQYGLIQDDGVSTSMDQHSTNNM